MAGPGHPPGHLHALRSPDRLRRQPLEHGRSRSSCVGTPVVFRVGTRPRVTRPASEIFSRPGRRSSSSGQGIGEKSVVAFVALTPRRCMGVEAVPTLVILRRQLWLTAASRRRRTAWAPLNAAGVVASQNTTSDALRTLLPAGLNPRRTARCARRCPVAFGSG